MDLYAIGNCSLYVKLFLWRNLSLILLVKDAHVRSGGDYALHIKSYAVLLYHYFFPIDNIDTFV